MDLKSIDWFDRLKVCEVEKYNPPQIRKFKNLERKKIICEFSVLKTWLFYSKTTLRFSFSGFSE